MSDNLWPEEPIAVVPGQKNIVVLSGAGMSAESGIPTFRHDEMGISMWA